MRRFLFDRKTAYIAAVLFLPLCVVNVIIGLSSNDHSALWFYASFGAAWALIWIEGTLTQLRKLRFRWYWILPLALLLMGLPLPIGDIPGPVRWIGSTAVVIFQIAFICIPPRESGGSPSNVPSSPTP